MPRPIDARARYYPGLDGLRALAVGLVIAFHLGFSRFSGGLLGVGVFFTLSGFLITKVLLGSWQRRGTAALGPFWIHRFRRLMPAMVMLLMVAMLVVVTAQPHAVRTRGAQALAGLLYMANWHTIWASQSYFSRFASIGPFDHLWSLSVEEQFYVVWPPLLLVLLALTGQRFRVVAVATAALAAASFGELALLAGPGFDNTRAYEGTDTRAGGLLVGAALALWLHSPHQHDPRHCREDPLHPALGWVRRIGIDLAGMAGVTTIMALAMCTTEYSMNLYRWGMLVLSLATAAVLVALCTPGSLLGRIFAIGPLRWVGERSYGIYLWHLPVIVFAPSGWLHAAPWARDGMLVGISVVLAAVSWRWVEDPIRRNGLRGSLLPRHDDPASSATQVHRDALVFGLLALASLQTLQLVGGGNANTQNARNPAGSGTVTSSQAPREQTTAKPEPHHTTTSCTSVVYIGDSTSEGLVSSTYLPAAADRLPARLRAVGVRTLHPEIAGARSIVETWGGMPNAQTIAHKYIDSGYHGCWILALGTNDAANYPAGGPDYATRINLMMNIIPSNDPVMWINVKTQVASGFYSAQNAVDWDNALVAAAHHRPNMRIADWASTVRPSWFISDNIHFNTPGYRARSLFIAKALANAFPRNGSKDTPIIVGS